MITLGQNRNQRCCPPHNLLVLGQSMALAHHTTTYRFIFAETVKRLLVTLSPSPSKIAYQHMFYA